MAGTLIDMYLKYRNKVERAMEDDNYYNYMMGLISEAPNEIEQFNRVLHKKVDEKWLNEVEAGIPALMQVISNPRRFIKAEEEIVPVELAKKITADSVKHLARNTQFISDIDKNILIYTNRDCLNNSTFGDDCFIRKVFVRSTWD